MALAEKNATFNGVKNLNSQKWAITRHSDFYEAERAGSSGKYSKSQFDFDNCL
jgi:hypothetical protein